MMQELQLRQAEAVQQHNIEEAQRLAAICNRLQASLKLAGLPELQMKSAGGGGLQLKLGDSSNIAGSPGLPGIYLEHSSDIQWRLGADRELHHGAAASTHSAIRQRPVLRRRTTVEDRRRRWCVRDGGERPDRSVRSHRGRPAHASRGLRYRGHDHGCAQHDAKAVGRPGHQDRQSAAGGAAAPDGCGAQLHRGKPAGCQSCSRWPSRESCSRRRGAANPAPAGAAASQPAQSQLQQIAATSQSAATAASPEDAAALARSGFDTPGGGTVQPAVAISGSPRWLLSQLRPAASPMREAMRRFHRRILLPERPRQPIRSCRSSTWPRPPAGVRQATEQRLLQTGRNLRVKPVLMASRR